MRILILVWVTIFSIILQSSPGWAGAPFSREDLKAYVGHWKGRGFHRKFPFAQGAEITFWQNNGQDLEGAILLTKGQEYCVGKIRVSLVREALVFSVKEGSLCSDFKGSSFGLFRPVRNNMFGLRFNLKSSAAKLYNTNYFYKQENSNAKLDEYVAFFRKKGKDPSFLKNTRKQSHAHSAGQVETAMHQSYSPDFPESKMIGVWAGEFVSRKMVYSAKMIFWSSIPYRHHSIVGVVVFDKTPMMKNLCPSGVIKLHDPLDLISISYLNLKNIKQSCNIINSSGKAFYNADSDSLMFVLDNPIGASTFKREERCWRMEQGTFKLSADRCEAGIFHRTQADDKLRKIISGIQWGKVKPPLTEEQNILFDHPDQIQVLAEKHERAISKNALVDQQIKNEKEEFKRQKEAERSARVRAARAKEKADQERIARNKAQYNMWRGGGIPDSNALGQLPTVSGPFDGLPGKDLLNAIYLQDWHSVKEINNYYSTEKVLQYQKFMGGNNWSDVFVESGFKAIDLSKIVLAVYLFNYQKNFRECLKPDAEIFEIVEHVPDMSFENILGVEIAKSYGYTTREKFRVNKEFSPGFRKVGRMKPEGVMLTISEFLLNQGGTDIKKQAISGIKQMMNRYDCNSPEIKKFEQALVKVGLR